jgi:ribonucleotide reductase beta subunit family protein with ferritin-like domain
VTTVSLHDPQTLYRHWEEQQWSPFAIDLVADAEQWQTMGGEGAISCCGPSPR